MEKGDLVAAVIKQDGDLIAGKKELPPDPNFNSEFRNELARFIYLASSNIEPVVPVETRQHEGSVGYLPPPAKRVVVRDILSGRPVTPLRVYEETEVVGKPQRQIEEVAIHVVVVVDPVTVVDKSEIAATVNTLLAIRDFPKDGVVLDWNASDTDVLRVNKVRPVLHLIRRGALGNYSSENFPLVSLADCDAALSSYQRSLAGVLEFLPGENPDRDFVAHDVISARIAGEIEEERDSGKISLPIVVVPKTYQSESIPLGGGSYRTGGDASMLNLFGDDAPFILVPKAGNPELRKWLPADKWGNRQYVKV